MARMKHSSKYIICTFAFLLRSTDGETSHEWNGVEAYLMGGRLDDSERLTTTGTTQRRNHRRRSREVQHMTFEDFIGERVLKSSKKGGSSIKTKSSKKSKRYRPPLVQMVTTTPRPTPHPTPHATRAPSFTPSLMQLNDIGVSDGAADDDDDDDSVSDGALTYPPGQVRWPDEEVVTKYGIGVHPTVPHSETELSQPDVPQPTPRPTYHQLLRPLQQIEEYTRLVPETPNPTQRITEPPTLAQNNEDLTLSPTVYLYRHQNHHAAFQAQTMQFKEPIGSETVTLEATEVHPANMTKSEENASTLILLDEKTNDDPSETMLNGKPSSPNCRSSLCSTRTKANQNNYCCNPSKCRQDDIIHPVPSLRFGSWMNTVYTNLTMLYFADVFGYTKDTWEQPETNPVEQLSFADLRDQELLSYMGVSSFQYDCWFNHYQAYTWDELECYGIADAYTTLGWDASTWGTIHSATWSFREQNSWDDLSSAEQEAARKVCYFRELWNGEKLIDWSDGWLNAVDTIDIPIHANHTTPGLMNDDEDSDDDDDDDDISIDVPGSPPSATPNRDDSTGGLPSLVPTAEKESQSLVPSSLEAGSSPSAIPSMISSTSPSAMVSESPSKGIVSTPAKQSPSSSSCLSSACSNRTAENMGNFCCGMDTYCDRKKIVLPIPTFRWYSWDNLDDSVKGTARELGYTKDLWNHPGAYELERWSFGFLSKVNQQNILEMGFTPQTWDCWQNHYQDYSWEELVCFGLEWAAEALGWTETSWPSQPDWPQLRNRRDWVSLSYDERIAARELCYLPALWEHIPLEDWDD